MDAWNLLGPTLGIVLTVGLLAGVMCLAHRNQRGDRL
jgi:hypothetical protein